MSGVVVRDALFPTRPPVPDELRTARLLLRRWQPRDAVALAPVLEANAARLRPWISPRVAEPVPLEQLVERLAEFSSAFDVGREWRYGVYTLDSAELLGELDLFPRAETGRVAFAAADRIEIGYWLRDDATGMGYATEAAGAALELALALPGIFRVTVHCDERNIESAAIPRRLGFRLAATIDEPAVTPGAADIRLQIWEYSRAESAER